jgi:hypothetical protein
MRMIDAKCPGCERIYVDVLLRAKDSQEEYIYPSCDTCGTMLERVYLQGSCHGVVGDDIPGGVFYAKNGMCYPDGSPRPFTLKSDMKKFAKELGLTQHVEHQGGKGSDKSKHTQRFV